MAPATSAGQRHGARGRAQAQHEQFQLRRNALCVRANPQSEKGKGKGKSKSKAALIGNKRGFSGGNPLRCSNKARKTERSNDRRSVSKSKSRSPTRPPSGASAFSSVVTTRSRLGAGDIVVPSNKLQNHEDAEIDVNAFKNYLEKQEQDVEFVFSDDDAKGDGTDDESERRL